MPASDITPAGLLIGFAIAVAVVALIWAALARRSRRRSPGGVHLRHDDGPVIDLAYLERAIKADEEAAARRTAENRPLLSRAPDAQPDRSHRLPTDER